ncbi:MAG: choice-of-anchor tandem repeat GloVer-containing protein [Candidatus Cybelea sp.]
MAIAEPFFRVSATGAEKVLHSFGSGSDGEGPVPGLTQLNGLLCGTTRNGGMYGDGTVFSISRSDTEKVLHSFGSGSDGKPPTAGLIDVNGTLYGTTFVGGTHGKGTVFALTP